ncbi:restriction endonuclease fold toxin-2 domain-containing protein [Vitiosangium sp. GDMCC 1.1324]|uniref:restriction endonuclease fold toxin-2 domain-containing protein n=1 Tax=Vitiosangium sp. (strain GDMCC 1.1324) TaxID=2138576 RepID=UPI0011B6EBF6
MPGSEKLCRASIRSISELPASSSAELRALLTPENLATMTALTSVWLGTQGVPVAGEAVDAALVSLGVVLVAIQAREVSNSLWMFANRALTARTDDDLKAAALSLSQAISKVGVNVVAFVLTKKVVSKVSKSRPPPPEPPAVTPEGVVISDVSTPRAPARSAAPAAAVGGAHSQSTAGPTSGDRVVAPKQVEPKAFASWIEQAEKHPVRENSPASQYQIKQAGPNEVEVSGGGREIRADGARAGDAHLLEVKHVDNPATSPYVPGSTCNEKVRGIVRAELLSQLRRYAAVILDPATPVVALELITNEARALPYFEALLVEAEVPGRVVVRP